jgi:hypothetical protein
MEEIKERDENPSEGKMILYGMPGTRSTRIEWLIYEVISDVNKL